MNIRIMRRSWLRPRYPTNLSLCRVHPVFLILHSLFDSITLTPALHCLHVVVVGIKVKSVERWLLEAAVVVAEDRNLGMC